MVYFVKKQALAFVCTWNVRNMNGCNDYIPKGGGAQNKHVNTDITLRIRGLANVKLLLQKPLIFYSFIAEVFFASAFITNSISSSMNSCFQISITVPWGELVLLNLGYIFGGREKWKVCQQNYDAPPFSSDTIVPVAAILTSSLNWLHVPPSIFVSNICHGMHNNNTKNSC